MFQSEHLQEKWAPLLNYEGLDPIKDSHRKAVTAVLLENQEKFLREQSAFENGGMLMEQPTMNTGSGATPGFSADATATGPVAGFDPVLISLIRRSMPNLVAYDLDGVQPMNGPTGLIFAMRSRYGTKIVPLAMRHSTTKQIPPSPVATTLPTTRLDRAIPSLVWVLLHSLAPTLLH